MQAPRDFSLWALIAFTAPLLLASPATFAAGQAVPPPQNPVAVEKAGATKIAVTPEDHLAKAEGYKKKAAAYRAEADVHRKMLGQYVQGNIYSTGEREDPFITKMRIHCEGYISKAEALATEAEKFADFHRMRAAELQGK